MASWAHFKFAEEWAHENPPGTTNLISPRYYSNLNYDLFVRLPVTAAQVLEVGCGAGVLGAAYLARNPGAIYTGVELNAAVAREAAEKLSRVIVGDIESEDVIVRLRALGTLFDLVVLGDVLEHLRDPWKTLRELKDLTMAGSICVTCVPNVAHWSLLVQQLNGRWDYADQGLLDHTHLRFFTYTSLDTAFKEAGWNVIDGTGRVFNKEDTERALAMFRPIAASLNIPADKLDMNLSAFQWVMRATNGPVRNALQVVGIGLAKLAGCNEARIDYPLATINTLPDMRATWGEETVKLPPGGPGVMIYQRRYFTDERIDKQVERLIQAGWVVVLDVDDDPTFKDWVDTDFYAFKRVHAITVSSERLAAAVRQWNPNVMVFPNAIFELPEQRNESLDKATLKVFFGALNRASDWEPIMDPVVDAALATTAKLEFVVVHDSEFFDRIPDSIAKVFYPTLSHQDYLRVLAGCDIALLPLADTEFNRMKSDLKLIECAACGVVPICAPTVYADNPDHAKLAVFADLPEAWGKAILNLCVDPLLRQNLLAEGYAYVKANRMHAHQAERRRQYYFRLRAELPSLEASRRKRMQSLTWRPNSSSLAEG